MGKMSLWWRDSASQTQPLKSQGEARTCSTANTAACGQTGEERVGAQASGHGCDVGGQDASWETPGPLWREADVFHYQR